MAKKTAAKKTSAKRTPAQKRATQKMIAANKKRASKKKASSKKRSVRRGVESTTRTRTRTTPRGYTYGGARRTNPSDMWTREVLKHIIVIKDSTTDKIVFLKDDGSTGRIPESAALFDSKADAKAVAESLTPAENVNVYITSIEVRYNKRKLQDLIS